MRGGSEDPSPTEVEVEVQAEDSSMRDETRGESLDEVPGLGLRC